MAWCPVRADLLSLFEAVDSGSRDARTGGQTTDDTDAFFVFGEVDPVQRNRARGFIDDPDKSLSAFFEHSGRGHPENPAVGLVGSCSDGASEPEAFRRIIQGDTNAAHARYRIGLRRNFANLALDLIGRK